ncbi:DUF1540 domain-containing protein [Scatolibacter rhodanostii]|uniref:DUF1540 domain-containing protein n=1 Tax=Scatolibacter rhodanostii TaxID=2014781 RepID=UPI0013566830|nr:DUF1540 domain-containing protein [Scatolibacter rhodanostii]
MNHLECEVSTCMHFDKNLCTLNKIMVEGPAAHDKEETCCMSFSEKMSSGQNAVGVPHDAKPQTGIDCKAENCTYNSSCKCTASNVKVANCHPNVSAKCDTHCATFAAG